MITAWKIIKLSEDYFSARNLRGKNIEVFVNPSKSEMRSVASKDSKVVRFTADARPSEQKVYVWDGSKAIHYEVLPLLGPDKIDTQPYIIGGLAKIEGDSAEMIGWDNFHHVMDVIDSSSRDNVIAFLKKLFGFDWKWLDRYFTATPYIEKRKKEFEEKIKNLSNKSKFGR